MAGLRAILPRALAVTALLLAAGCGLDTGRQKDIHFGQGVQYFDQGNFAEALAEFTNDLRRFWRFLCRRENLQLDLLADAAGW